MHFFSPRCLRASFAAPLRQAVSNLQRNSFNQHLRGLGVFPRWSPTVEYLGNQSQRWGQYHRIEEKIEVISVYQRWRVLGMVKKTVNVPDLVVVCCGVLWRIGEGCVVVDLMDFIMRILLNTFWFLLFIIIFIYYYKLFFVTSLWRGKWTLLRHTIVCAVFWSFVLKNEINTLF